MPDQLVHERRETTRQHLSEQLSKAVDQANWSVIVYGGGILSLAKEHQICLIHQVKTLTVQRPEGVESPNDIVFDDRPGCTVEQTGKPVRSRGLIGRHVNNGLPNFLLRKAMVNGFTVNGGKV